MVQRVTVPLAFDFRAWWDSSAWTIPEISQQSKTFDVARSRGDADSGSERGPVAERFDVVVGERGDESRGYR